MIYHIYFSPTGGTKKVGGIICGAWENCTEIDISLPGTDYSAFSFTADDLCILSFPVYEGRVPQPVLNNVRQMKSKATPAVMVATYGNRAVNDALLEMKDFLCEIGFVPIAAVTASIRHSGLPGIAAGRPDSSDVAQLKSCADKICRKYQEGDLTTADVPGNRPYIEIGRSRRHPIFEEDKCIGCGLCAEKCPTQVISPNDFSTPDPTACLACARCTVICPTGARHLNEERIAAFLAELSWMFVDRKPNDLYI